MSLFFISPTDLSTAYRALSALYNAGVGPTHAFSFMEESTECLPLKQALKQMSAATADGTPVSTAAAAYPTIFPALHRTVIAAGEASGLMPAALTGLAEMVDRDHALKQSVQREMMPAKMNLMVAGPLVLLLIGLGVVRPDAIGGLTLCLLIFFGILVVIAFVGAVLLVQINNEAEVRFGAIVNKVPAIGRVGMLMAENRFTQVLAVCHEAGVLPIRSIMLAAEACGSPSLSKKLVGAVPLVRDGKTMALSLEETGGLSDNLISMIKVGEESGKVTEVLYRAQEYQQSVIQTSVYVIKTYVSLLANVAVLGLGAMIVFISYGVL
jgi:type II secretory pathway component PulF